MRPTPRRADTRDGGPPSRPAPSLDPVVLKRASPAYRARRGNRSVVYRAHPGSGRTTRWHTGALRLQGPGAGPDFGMALRRLPDRRTLCVRCRPGSPAALTTPRAVHSPAAAERAAQSRAAHPRLLPGRYRTAGSRQPDHAAPDAEQRRAGHVRRARWLTSTHHHVDQPENPMPLVRPPTASVGRVRCHRWHSHGHTRRRHAPRAALPAGRALLRPVRQEFPVALTEGGSGT